MKALEKRFFSCVCSDAVCRSELVKREKAWSAFHRLKNAEVGKMWCDYFRYHDGIPKLSPLVYQHVSQRLYSDLIKHHLTANFEDHTAEIPVLTADQENILRYAAGYVPFKLLKQYEKSPALDSVSMIECLSTMAVKREESSLLEYTTK